MSGSRDQRVRQRIAAEAARIMAQESVHDFLVAKKKTAVRLGIAETRHLPSNTEVEDALQDYQRLFKSNSQPGHLRESRRVALEAMRFLVQFHPRLVGNVLTGVADQHSDIVLHVFADAPEEIAVFLMDEGIPHESSQRRLRMEREIYREFPTFRFLADGFPIELVTFPVNGLRQAPCSPVDGRPMRRANITAVENLLDQVDAQGAG